MIQEIIASGDWLPYTFAFLMGLSMLIYSVLDGYDLGVGILSLKATDAEKDRMISSIGPFWDANETWLVLGVGILLVAFPTAHGVILTNLYLPVAFMLFGLIMRGVSFDFRAKVDKSKKHIWNKTFFLGSFLTAFAQGYMLGHYIVGFNSEINSILFAILIGFIVVAGYSMVGACWLIMKTEKELQKKSVMWAKKFLVISTLGIMLISLATPFVSERIFNKWFTLPNFIYLLPIPLLTGLMVLKMFSLLNKLPLKDDKKCWQPFALTLGIFVLCFIGLAYSFFPYIVPEQLTIVEAASAHSSLMIILVGALVVLPVLIGYTFLLYKVFHGKATDLNYD